MKNLLLLSLFLPLFATAQTVPNGNFENWIWVGMIEHFEFWTSENSEDYNIVSVDFDAYEGDAAMRVTAQPTGLGEFGEATNLFDISSIPPALNFYAKTGVEFGGVSVEITFLNGDVEVYSEDWYGITNFEEYTLVSIPLNQVEPSVITQARIKVSAEVGDLIAGTAWISVDAMEFGLPLSVEKTALSAFKIYPNPASEYLTIQSADRALGSIKIFDAQGKMVFEKRILDTSVNIDIRKFSPGIYTLTNDHSDVKAAKFIVVE